MKKKLLILLSCILCCILVITGCGKAPLVGGPSADSVVYGNGGMAVVKGNYLYFSNAYKPLSEVKVNENKFGQETLSAIYRVKIEENGLIALDENGFITGAEIVAEQISGYEYSGLYIFGDYIYYTTPYTSKDGDGNDITGLVKFCRVKLDGTNYKEIYTTKAYTAETSKYAMTEVDGNVYINVYDGTDLISVEVKGSRVNVRTLVEGVTSADFVDQTTVNGVALCEFERYAYYTRAVDSKKDGLSTGTVVGRIKYATDKPAEETLYKGQKAYTIDKVANNRLFVKLSGYIYSTADFSFDENKMTKYTYQADASNSGLLGDYIVVEDNNQAQTTDANGFIIENKQDLGFVAVFDTNKIVYFKGLNNSVTIFDGDEESVEGVTLLYVTENNDVYYMVKGKETVYRKNLLTDTKNTPATEVVSNVPVDTSSSDAKKYFDFDNNYFFYYDTVADTNEVNHYLHIVKVDNGYKNDENENIAKYLGVLDLEDTEEKTEEDEEVTA